MSASSLGSKWARNHCWPLRSFRGAGDHQPARERAARTPGKVAGNAKTALCLDRNSFGQQGGPARDRAVSEYLFTRLGGSPFVDEAADGVADRHTPAGRAVGARDFFYGCEEVDTRAAEPAIGCRYQNRKQVGVEQSLCGPVREPTQALRSQRLLADQPADRLGPIERRGGRVWPRICYTLPLSFPC